MRQGEKFIHAGVFTQKFSRDVMFTPYMNTSLTRRPVFTQEDNLEILLTPYMNTSLTRRPIFTQEGMQKKKTSRRWNETGE